MSSKLENLANQTNRCIPAKILEITKKFISEGKLRGLVTQYKKGQTVFYEGHNPCGFYLVDKGQLKLTKKNNRNFSNLLGPKSLIGLEQAYQGEAFRWSCTATVNSEVIFFPKNILLEITGAAENDAHT